MDQRGRSNTKLSPSKVLQIVWHWICGHTGEQTARLTGIQPNTVGDWFNFCREVCQIANRRSWDVHKLGDGLGRIFPEEMPMIVIQADESLLRGKRKYNRGRMLLGDGGIPVEDRAAAREIAQELDIVLPRRGNYNNRVQGPWIVGLALCVREDECYKTREVRLFHVPDRRTETLNAIFEANVQENTLVWTDGWAGYGQLGRHFAHETVIHDNEFVSAAGVHTQNIERAWESLKLYLIRNKRGTSPATLDSYLAEFSYRSCAPKDEFDFFNLFINDASTCFPIEW